MDELPQESPTITEALQVLEWGTESASRRAPDARRQASSRAHPGRTLSRWRLVSVRYLAIPGVPGLERHYWSLEAMHSHAHWSALDRLKRQRATW